MNEENNKSGDLVPSERTLSQRIASGREQVEAIKELTKVALSLCRKKSIINQDGHPYIKSDAAAFIGGRFGVQIVDMKWEPTETFKQNDGFPDEIVWTVSGYFEFDGNRFPCAGVSTTRDKFYCLRKDKQGKKYYLPYNEIDMASLKLKCVTRLRGNASRAALNLNDLDWDEVTEATGIKKEDVVGVEYGGGSGKKQDLSDAGKSALQEIKELLNYCFQGVAKDAKDWLFKETTFTIADKETGEQKTISGKQDPNKLTEKQIPHILTKLKKLKNDMMEAEANPPGAKP